jgi:1,4-dihydroxy-2-naphthoyl-CoA synthase
MSVRVERAGPITTVILDRPEVKNAVDRATAQALADAFRAFDADAEARVGILLPTALANELAHGRRALAEAAAGAARFAAGAGRHGVFDE